MKIIINWIIAAVVILIAVYLVPGVTITSFWVALVAAMVFGVINILTLGLFTLVINALLTLLVASLVPGFAIAGFWVALIFAIVLAAINWAVYKVF